MSFNEKLTIRCRIASFEGHQGHLECHLGIFCVQGTKRELWQVIGSCKCKASHRITFELPLSWASILSTELTYRFCFLWRGFIFELPCRSSAWPQPGSWGFRILSKHWQEERRISGWRLHCQPGHWHQGRGLQWLASLSQTRPTPGAGRDGPTGHGYALHDLRVGGVWSMMITKNGVSAANFCCNRYF